MIVPLPVERALLASPLQARRDDLVNVDVLDALFILVVLMIERNGCKADGLSDEPADALQREDSVGITGLLLVLHEMN